MDLSTEITGQLVGHLNDLGIETHGSKDMEEDLKRREEAVFAMDEKRKRIKESFSLTPQDLTTSQSPKVESNQTAEGVQERNAAKIQKSIDGLTELADVFSKQQPTTIGEIINAFTVALNITEKRSRGKRNVSQSERNKYVLPDGTTFSIRVGNHNASGDTYIEFDFNQDYNFSLTFKSRRSKNTFKENPNVLLDEKAYFIEDIRSYDGNALQEIALSLANFMRTGEYIDTTGLAKTNTSPKQSSSDPEFFTVYHGTANKFSRFDHSHMGEGEGAQVYGWGTYVAVNRNTSLSYAKKLVGINGWRFDGRPLYKGYLNALKAPKILRKLLSEFNSTDEMIRELNEYANSSTISLTHVLDRIWLGVSRKEAKELANELKREWKHLSKDSRRYLYRVEIPDNIKRRFLEWHKPIGNRLTDLINGMLIGQNVYFKPDITGRDLYNSLASIFGSKKKASIFLGSIDIRGVHYYGKTDGECYVVFDENDLTIKGITEMFKTRNGEVYGYATPEGTIYLDERIIKPEHPIHEYTHLWDRVVRSKNEALWNRGVELMKQTGLWNEYLNHPEYGQRWMLLQASRLQLLRMHLTVLHSKVNTTSTKRMAGQG
ncbi:MAG: hypothetical protein IJP79_01175 [Paludibacteraceae bacterium]|nr:hypothetical protein [Paludibacteraceae bacterium]MBQ7748803.1 hypothetical protein [Paludibacteraceae bacterium]